MKFCISKKGKKGKKSKKYVMATKPTHTESKWIETYNHKTSVLTIEEKKDGRVISKIYEEPVFDYKSRCYYYISRSVPEYIPLKLY